MASLSSASVPGGDAEEEHRGTEQPHEEEHCGDGPPRAYTGYIEMVVTALRPRRSVKGSLLQADRSLITIDIQMITEIAEECGSENANRVTPSDGERTRGARPRLDTQDKCSLLLPLMVERADHQGRARARATGDMPTAGHTTRNTLVNLLAQRLLFERESFACQGDVSAHPSTGIHSSPNTNGRSSPHIMWLVFGTACGSVYIGRNTAIFITVNQQ
ncbi:hypothetical protein N9L68_05530 [bacterium]|nr:hypothetical protein [bacterium]